MKTLIITGASRGIGAAAAGVAARAGARLVLNGRDPDRLAGVVDAVSRAGGKARAVVADLADPAACQEIVRVAHDEFGEVDALVNNAGLIQPVASIADGEPGEWETNLRVNLLAPALLTRAALPGLRKSRGRIINLSSGAAIKPIRGWAAYCATKAAINHFTRVIAAEEPEVVAIAYSPGMTDTDMQAVIRERGPSGMHAEELDRFVSAHREGALRSVEEAAAALIALAFEAPGAWSGEYITIEDPRIRSLMSSAKAHDKHTNSEEMT